MRARQNVCVKTENVWCKTFDISTHEECSRNIREILVEKTVQGVQKSQKWLGAIINFPTLFEVSWLDRRACAGEVGGGGYNRNIGKHVRNLGLLVL